MLEPLMKFFGSLLPLLGAWPRTHQSAWKCIKWKRWFTKLPAWSSKLKFAYMRVMYVSKYWLGHRPGWWPWNYQSSSQDLVCDQSIVTPNWSRTENKYVYSRYSSLPLSFPGIWHSVTTAWELLNLSQTEFTSKDTMKLILITSLMLIGRKIFPRACIWVRQVVKMDVMSPRCNCLAWCRNIWSTFSWSHGVA